MIRAILYLVFAGAIWFAEGYIFSRLLAFSAIQTALAGGCYLALYLAAAHRLVRAFKSDLDAGDVARWRYLSLAPMLVVVLGSFASLPLMLVILGLGKLV
jgi:hypothetical protein